LADTAIRIGFGEDVDSLCRTDNDFSSLLRSPLFQSMVH